MPWRGASPGDPWPTLGWEVAEWIQANCVIPDGDFAGDPFILTDEQLRFVVWFYRLDPISGKFHYLRGGSLLRPQKWGKGPLSAAIICAEAEGPVLFDGWNAVGDPVGRPWATPWIQVTAVSEDQTDNVYRALVPMIQQGPLIEKIPDTGQTRINLRGGGRIEPVTSSASSRLGQRVTFALQDETHSWLRVNGGRKLADTQRRNVAGMSGRWLETTNAYDPAEGSVAQITVEGSRDGVYIDDVDPGSGSIRNKRERRRMLRKVYGDAHWIDLDRIDAEIEDLILRDPAQAERFFLNRKVAAEDSAFDFDRWLALTDRSHVVPDGAVVVLGVDGARFHDSLAIIATEVESGFQWPLAILERPDRAGDDYEHDFDKADEVVSAAFAKFDIWRAYIDPQHIGKLVDRWQGRYGSDRVIEWRTERIRPTALALSDYRAAMSGGDVSHDGDTTFGHHIGNARRRNSTAKGDDGRALWTIGKETSASSRKIDAAMAGCLSWTARGDCIADGYTGTVSLDGDLFL